MSSTGRYRDALAVAEFRAIFAAHVVSVTGMVIANFALTVLIYARTGSPLLSALVFTVTFAPYLVAGTLLNALTDRLPIRRLLVWCNLASAALTAVMAVPGTPVVMLLALAFGRGLIAPVIAGARAATLPDVVPGPAFVPARSLLRLVSQSALLGGTAVAGVLLTGVSAPGVLIGNAACFAVSAALLRFGTVERRPEDTAERPSLIRDSIGGMGAMFRVRPLRRVLLLSWAVPALGVAAEALAVPYTGSVHAGSLGAGLFLSAVPAGAVLGEVLTNTLADAGRQVRLVGWAAATVFAPMLVFVLHPPLAIALPLLVVSGLGFAHHLGLDRLLMDVAPEELRGRALNLQSTGLMFWQGLGFAAAGAAAQFLGAAQVIALAGCCGLLCVACLIGPGPARRPEHRTDAPVTAASE
ncbi:MFS transporter [Kitasatospora sp. NPDC006786]|uniref:MFS transporter n=1 Tax=unclassified Kitasatospora TaxID=2633591 RepID=UPI0033FB1CBE